jgi:myosin heavy subunit
VYSTPHHTPIPSALSMEELEAQIADLNDTVELLTLDKEQLLIDKDILEEKCLELEKQIETLRDEKAKSGSQVKSVDTVQLEALRTENEKLREALFHLNDRHRKEQESHSADQRRIADLLKQCEELLAYKTKTEAEVEELRQTVDSMSASEALIEKLAEENQELADQVKDCKQTISILEDAQELNEELDYRQRQQIEADRSTIQSLTLALQSAQTQVSDKTTQILDQQRRLEQVKESNSQLRAELDKLQLLMSADFRESQELAEKLRRLQRLQDSFYSLQLHCDDLQYQLQTVGLQRSRLAVNCGRLEALVSTVPVLASEAKLLSQELLSVQTISQAFDLSSQISNVTNLLEQPAMQALLESLPGTRRGAADWKRLGGIVRLRSLCLGALTAFGTISALLRGDNTTINNGKTFDMAQWIQLVLKVKDFCDRTLSTQARLIRRLQSRIQEQQRQQDSNDINGVEIEGEKNGAGDQVLGEELESMSEQSAALDALLRDIITMLSPSYDATNNALEIESDCCLFLCSEQEIAPRLRLEALLQMALLLLPVQAQSNNTTSAVLKEARLELLQIIIILGRLRHASASSLASLCKSVAEGAVRPLLEGLGQRDISWGPLLQALRAMRASMGSSAGINTDNLTQIEDEEVLRDSLRCFPGSIALYPANKFAGDFLSSNSITSNTNDQSLIAERYWQLLLQHSGNSSGTNNSAGNAVTDLVGMETEALNSTLTWRQRWSTLRDRLNVIPSNSSTTNNTNVVNASNSSNSSSSAITATTSNANANTVSKSVHDATVRTLEEKSDALAAALSRLADLEAALTIASASSTTTSNGDTTKSAGNGSNSEADANEEAERLRKELQMLEKALHATEQRAETFAKELRQLKDSGNTSSTTSASTTGSAAAVPKLRRGTVSSQNLLAEASVANPTTPTGSTNGGNSLNRLQDEVDFWRSTALRRITRSLAPLPVPSVTTSTSSASTTLTVPVRSCEVNLSVPTDLTQLQQLHQQLRLERVRRARLRPLSGVISAENGEETQPRRVRKRERDFWIQVLSPPVVL